MSFADLGVPPRLVERLNARGITEAFPIQAAAIPDGLARRDVVGRAITGSGKTLAFALPLVATLKRAQPRKPVALVLVPTRELAAQVQREIAQLSGDRGQRVISIYGGTPYHGARKALNHGVDVVVACPGRLEDMLEQRALDLGDVVTVVVDEADRMADMGFLPAVRRIVAATSPERHVMLFSATLGPDVASLVRQFTRDAARHDVVGDDTPLDIDHYFWRVGRERRPDATADIIKKYERAIVFTRTKHGADRLVRQLGERGVSAVALHGDRSQSQRERALRSVQNGQVKVLVATDVAARGIHIDLMPVVVHYDPPAQATDYLHRSGRTGRAGASGTVISLVGDDVVAQVKQLQRQLGIEQSIDSPQDAKAIRLGAVDDAVGAERLDGRLDERPTRQVVSASKRAPRGFERRELKGPAAVTPRSRRSDDTRPTRGYQRPTSTTRPAAARRARGGEAVVSFFNDAKGFGFASDEKGDDLFIHFTNIVGDGFRSLSQGQTISFEEARGPKGREAKNVRVIGAGRPGR